MNLRAARRHHQWLELDRLLEPFEIALDAAEPDEVANALFRLARKHRDWHIGRPWAVIDVLGWQASLRGIPRDEAKKIIRAALYWSKEKLT